MVAAALMMAGCFGSGGGGKNAVVRGSIACKARDSWDERPSSSPRVVVSGKAAQRVGSTAMARELIVGLDPSSTLRKQCFSGEAGL